MTASPTKLRLKIRSDPATLASVRQAVERFCSSGGLDIKACEDVGLCVNEALANVIRHAYDGATDQPIEVTAQKLDRSIQICIRDWGKGVNPMDLPLPKPDPLKPGGLGLVCLKKMMDKVAFKPQPKGMLLEMTRERNHARVDAEQCPGDRRPV
jgi:serine/threonine-protein kinase RsbW